MKYGYIRLRKNGPSLEEQREGLEKYGARQDNANSVPGIFVDDPEAKTARVFARHLTERSKLLEQIQPGDVIVIADIASLAISQADWIDTIYEIAKAGTSLIIADTGKERVWGSASADLMGKLLADAHAVRDQLKIEQTAKARQVRSESDAPRKRRSTVFEKYSDEQWRLAREMWAQMGRFSGKEVEQATTIPIITLNRQLGARSKFKGVQTEDS